MKINTKNINGKHRGIKYSDVISIENLKAASKTAMKGKSRNKGVIKFCQDIEGNLKKLQEDLISRSFHSSEGVKAIVHDPSGKERILHKMPFYPDHIVHHALMRIIAPVLLKATYYESGAGVKGKGIHFVASRTARWIDEHKSSGRIYYCKIDFRKFYGNVDQQKIYDVLCHMFRDEGIRYLLKEIITACESGLGIGLYPIQTLTNYYLTSVCRTVCSKFKVKIEIYCDDIVILSEDKKKVWAAANYIHDYAQNILGQPIHENYSVQIIDEKHYLDFVGYQFFFNHILLRKRNKIRLCRRMSTLKNQRIKKNLAIAYKGWLKHCNGYNLWTKVKNKLKKKI